jgi:hypothetical protein
MQIYYSQTRIYLYALCLRYLMEYPFFSFSFFLYFSRPIIFSIDSVDKLIFLQCRYISVISMWGERGVNLLCY